MKTKDRQRYTSPFSSKSSRRRSYPLVYNSIRGKRVMEFGTQVLELLKGINETSAINEKSRRLCSLIRRSRRRKVHCLSFGRCVTAANMHAEPEFPKMSEDVIWPLMRSSRDWKRSTQSSYSRVTCPSSIRTPICDFLFQKGKRSKGDVLECARHGL